MNFAVSEYIEPPQGSPEWVAAINDYREIVGGYPWESLPGGAWVVTIEPGSPPAVHLTKAGLYWLRSAREFAPNIVALFDQAVAEVEAVDLDRLTAIHNQVHDQIHQQVVALRTEVLEARETLDHAARGVDPDAYGRALHRLRDAEAKLREIGEEPPPERTQQQ